jgi:hypothetical protein
LEITHCIHGQYFEAKLGAKFLKLEITLNQLRAGCSLSMKAFPLFQGSPYLELYFRREVLNSTLRFEPRCHYRPELAADQTVTEVASLVSQVEVTMPWYQV